MEAVVLRGNPTPSIERPPRQRSWTVGAAALFFFCALSVAMTWPLARDLRHLVSDAGDPYLTTWILDWDLKALLHHPLSLFDANIFFPSRLTLAFSENLVGAAIFGLPLFAAGLPPIEVYSIVFLLGMAISGFGAWALADELTGNAGASLLAGIAYAYVPFRFDQLPHIQMQWGGFLPLFLLFLFRSIESRKTRDLIGFVACFILSGMASVHFAVFGGIALLITTALELTRRGLWRDRWTGRRLLPAFGVSAGALALFFLPYTLASRLYHFHRSLGEIAFYSARPTSFLSAGVRSKLLGAATAPFARPEAQLYPGLVLVILAGVGAYRMRPRNETAVPKSSSRGKPPAWLDLVISALVFFRIVLAIVGSVKIRGVISIQEPYRLSMLIFLLIVIRFSLAFPSFVSYRNWNDFVRSTRWPPLAIWAAAMTLGGIVVALGGRVFLYREIFEIFPFVFGAIRCPVRGIVLAHLGLGVLATSGLSALQKGGRRIRRLGWPLFAVAGALFEYRAAPLDLYRADAEPLPVTRWLAARRFAGGVLELPMKLEDNFEYVYRVTQHDHPILNGFSGFFPKDFLDLETRFAATPVPPDTLDHVRRMKARLVVFHSNKATNEELSSIAAFLKAKDLSGELAPAAYFHDRRDTSLVFEIPAGAKIADPGEAAAAESSIDAFFANPGEAATPPYGWFDGPVNGAVIHGREIRGSGWAASDSGIDQIEISLDGKIVGRATYGFPRPDVIAAKPKVPCKDNCGYRYRIGNVPAGGHVLSTRFVGRNGKDVTLPSEQIWTRP